MTAPQAFASAPESPQATQLLGTAWYRSVETDKLTDKQTVNIVTVSTERVPARYGSNDFGQLIIRCEDDTTSLSVYFGGAFLADDVAGYGDVTFRIDDEPAITRHFVTSSSNLHLGLWTGGQAIPIIKTMLGRDSKSFILRATPFDEDPVQLEFSLSGIDLAIIPLRAACGW